LAIERDAVAVEVNPVVRIADYFSVHTNFSGSNQTPRGRSGAQSALGKYSF
jgi:hypothetical protein